MTNRVPDPEGPDAALSAVLQRMARETDVPEPDPAREALLLKAFDRLQLQQRPPRRRTGYLWMAGLTTAAGLLIAAGLVLPGTQRRGTPPMSDRRPNTPPDGRGAGSPGDAGEFVSWPGSSTLPPLESGQLLRVTLPVSMLPSLGLVPPASHTSPVRADVLVGQDGLARAVRLVD
jgi:hypothetical protein